mgnify:CR=1 FL=1
MSDTQQIRADEAIALRLIQVIRADAEVPTGLVQELIEKCQQAKFTKFSLKASQEQK